MYASEGSEPEVDDRAAAKPGEVQDESEEEMVLHAKLMTSLLQHGRLRIPQLIHILSPSLDSGQPPPDFEARPSAGCLPSIVHASLACPPSLPLSLCVCA